jgi:hypothetical protein
MQKKSFEKRSFCRKKNMHFSEKRKRGLKKRSRSRVNENKLELIVTRALLTTKQE